MKFLKWLLIIVLIIVAAIVIYGATQPSQMTVEESIEINAPAYLVFEEIEDFEAWDDWSAWNKMDPTMAQTYEGEKGTIGYKSAWKSENPMVGTGSQEIIEIRKNEYLKTKMLFNGEPTENFASFTLTETDGVTKVVWDMLGGETPFYLRIMNTIFKPMIVDSYQSSLRDLKGIVENKPQDVPNPHSLEVMNVEAADIISIRDTTTTEEIGTKLRELYTELSIYMAGHEGVEMNGMPIGIYHAYSPEMVDLEAAFPVVGDAVNSGRVVVGATPEGNALKGIHMGDYNASGKLHMAIQEYVNKRSDLAFGKVCWEIYTNDPTEVDSADVKTEIYYSLK